MWIGSGVRGLFPTADMRTPSPIRRALGAIQAMVVAPLSDDLHTSPLLNCQWRWETPWDCQLLLGNGVPIRASRSTQLNPALLAALGFTNQG